MMDNYIPYVQSMPYYARCFGIENINFNSYTSNMRNSQVWKFYIMENKSIYIAIQS